jgi:Tol biopolymer transport system component
VEFCSTGCEYIIDVVRPRPGSRTLELAGVGYDPAFSPHGDRLAFVEYGEGIPSGVAAGRLVATGDPTTPFDLADIVLLRRGEPFNSPRWSRTGRRILFAREDESGAAVLSSDMKTGRLSQIGPKFSFEGTPTGPGAPGAYGLDLDWASTGKIALTTHPGSLGHIGSELAVMNATGHGLRALTSGHFDFSPSWSPDGTKLAFVRGKITNNPVNDCPSVYTMRADGGNLEQITHNGCYSGVAWSPDGTRIAVDRDPGRERDDVLEVIPARGGRAERIATILSGSQNLDWQPLPQ